MGGRGAISTSGRIAKAAATRIGDSAAIATKLIRGANKEAGIAKRTNNAYKKAGHYSRGLNAARAASDFIGNANVADNLTRNARKAYNREGY